MFEARDRPKSKTCLESLLFIRGASGVRRCTRPLVFRVVCVCDMLLYHAGRFLLQLFRLIVRDQGFDQRLQLAIHHRV